MIKRTISEQDRPLRILAYGHDSVGLGHFNRMLAICERTRKCFPGAAVLMATGTPYVPVFDLPSGLDYIKLPALAKQDGNRYCGKLLRTSAERVLRCREALLLSAVQTFEPDLLLVDKAPAGVCGEMRSSLHWLREHHPHTRTVFGMRDIEDDPSVTIEQWHASGAYDALEQYYDEVWVYGMRNVFDVASEYDLSRTIRDRLRFMGYVVRDPCGHDQPASCQDRPVLVTVGGGTDGHEVLDAYLAHAAGAVSSKGRRSVLVGGPDLPRSTARALAARVADIRGAEWLDYTTCLACRIQESATVVSMGGYNTLCEVVSRSKPVVVIPRTQPRREQAIRATRWSQCSAIDVLLPHELTPRKLTERVVASLDGHLSAPLGQRLDFNGLERVERRFGALLGTEGCREAALHM